MGTAPRLSALLVCWACWSCGCRWPAALAEAVAAEDFKFYVDGSRFTKSTDGLGYRHSKDVMDLVGSDSYAAWGSLVSGELSDDGQWLEVSDGRYLPVKVGGEVVLLPEAPSPFDAAPVRGTKVVEPSVPPAEVANVATSKPPFGADEIEVIATPPPLGQKTPGGGDHNGEEETAEAAAAAAVAAAQQQGKKGNGQTCRKGFYRTDPVVWECHGAAGSGSVILADDSSVAVLTVPAHVRNFSFIAHSSKPLAVEVQDLSTSAFALRGNMRSDLKHYSAEGTDFTYAASQGGGGGGAGGYWATAHIVGSAHSRLSFYLRSSDPAGGGPAALTYSYEEIEPCPAAPEGCSQYDEAQAREAVRKWSCWAQGSHPDQVRAWIDLGAPAADASGKQVPWYRFEEVWRADPATRDEKAWQQAFHYLDQDRNQAVSREEFAAAFLACEGAADGAGAGQEEHANKGLTLAVAVVAIAVLAWAASVAFERCKARPGTSKARRDLAERPAVPARESYVRLTPPEEGLAATPGSGHGYATAVSRGASPWPGPANGHPGFMTQKQHAPEMQYRSDMVQAAAVASAGTPLDAEKPPAPKQAGRSCNAGMERLMQCVGFGRNSKTDWVCICGRTNAASASTCPQCHVRRSEAESQQALRYGGPLSGGGAPASLPSDEQRPLREAAPSPAPAPAPAPARAPGGGAGGDDDVFGPREEAAEDRSWAPPPGTVSYATGASLSGSSPPGPAAAKAPEPEREDSRSSSIASVEERAAEMLKTMRKHAASAEGQKEACSYFVSLSREPGGQDALVRQGGIEAVIQAMGTHQASAAVQRKACAAMQAMVNSNQAGRAEAVHHGGVEAILDAMAAHDYDQGVSEEACAVLQQMTADEEGRPRIASIGGAKAIVKAMTAHPASAGVQEHGAFALGNLAFEDESRPGIVDAGGVRALVGALEQHLGDGQVQVAAAFALHNMCCSEEAVEELASLRGAELLQRAMDTHPEVREGEEAAATLELLSIHPQPGSG